MNNVIRADFGSRPPDLPSKPARVYSIPHAILELRKRREEYRKASEEKRQRRIRYIIKGVAGMAKHLGSDEAAHACARYAALHAYTKRGHSVAYALQLATDQLRAAMIPLLTDRIWGEGERA